MGFLETLFGGSSEPSYSQLSTLTPGQSSLLDQLVAQLRGQLGKGVDSYPGTYTPGATENQQQIYQLVSSLLGGNAPLQKTGLSSLESMMKEWDPSAAEAEWSQAIKAPALENWQENTIPQIMEQFAAYDAAGSGPAMKAVAESGKDLNTNLVSILASTLYQDKNAYQNRQLNATQTGLQYPETLINSILGAATQERGIESEQGQEQFQDWLMEQPWANPWLSQLGLGLGTKAFENVGSGGGYQQGIFGQLLGAGANLGSAWLRGSPTYNIFG